MDKTRAVPAVSKFPLPGIQSASLKPSPSPTSSLPPVVDGTGQIFPIYQQQVFTHDGLRFRIEAENFASDNDARVAMAEVRNWVRGQSGPETTRLFVVLTREQAAIVNEQVFDHQQTPLPAMRAMQRRAATMVTQGNETAVPLLSLGACVL